MSTDATLLADLGFFNVIIQLPTSLGKEPHG